MKKALAVGGDLRLAVAAEYLFSQGWQVSVCHCARSTSEGISVLSDLRDTTGGDLLMLPVPISRDGVTVSGEGGVTLCDVRAICGLFDCVCAGGISSSLSSAIRNAGGEAYDLLCDERFVRENAALTAEAALGLAITELGSSPRDWCALIVGYGRIARRLCRLLMCCGAKVYVAARDPLDRDSASIEGAHTVDTVIGIADTAPLCNVIFNTAPAPLLTPEILMSLRSGSHIMELASGHNIELPGGSNCRLIPAPGLPGKIFPYTAGRLCAECAIRACQNRNENKKDY